MEHHLAPLQGSLYPALYRLTAAGKRRLKMETEKWNRMAEVMAGILAARSEEV